MGDGFPVRSVTIGTWHPEWGIEQFSAELVDYSHSEQNQLVESEELDQRLKDAHAELTKLRQELAEVHRLREQLRVAREGLEEIEDRRVEYDDGRFPEEGYLNNICAIENRARTTLAAIDAVGEPTP